MKIVEIAVSKSMKINTGNYESKDYFVSMKAEIEYDGQSFEICRQLFSQVDVALKAEIKADERGVLK